MKVVLLEDVDNLGYAGDIKEVRNGYGRNYLIPKGKALNATKNNINLAEEKRRNILRKVEKKIEEANKIRESLNGISVELEAKAGEKGKLFGSVTAADIFEKIKDKAENIDKKDIKLPKEGIKAVGEHEAEVAIYRDIKASLKVIVKASDEQ